MVDVRDTPPRLAPLANYGGQTMTRALFSDSPAINAGSGAISGTPVTDQRGSARSGAADIGAFEVNPSYVAPLPSSNTNSAYNQFITQNSGTATYAVSSGTLPPGLSLTNNFAPAAVVAIQGTPTTAGTYNFVIRTTDGGNTVDTNYKIVIVAPTAAAVYISGRVITPQNLGLTNALVTLTDSQGNSRTVLTTSRGSFRFADVQAGETYIISVNSKRYRFTTQVITVTEDLTGLVFTPE